MFWASRLSPIKVKEAMLNKMVWWGICGVWGVWGFISGFYGRIFRRIFRACGGYGGDVLAGSIPNTLRVGFGHNLRW